MRDKAGRAIASGAGQLRWHVEATPVNETLNVLPTAPESSRDKELTCVSTKHKHIQYPGRRHRQQDTCREGTMQRVLWLSTSLALLQILTGQPGDSDTECQFSAAPVSFSLCDL